MNSIPLKLLAIEDVLADVKLACAGSCKKTSKRKNNFLFLSLRGSDEAQGYLFSEALNANAVRTFAGKRFPINFH